MRTHKVILLGRHNSGRFPNLPPESSDMFYAPFVQLIICLQLQTMLPIKEDHEFVHGGGLAVWNRLLPELDSTLCAIDTIAFGHGFCCCRKRETVTSKGEDV